MQKRIKLLFGKDVNVVIERSMGTCVCGYFVGGGYEGATKELDNVVKREAELLQKHFNKDIEIRFNSDRMSGGAWVKDGKKNCSVGLSARLTNSELLEMSSEQRMELSQKEFRKLLDNPDMIIYETGISIKDTKNKVEKESTYILLDSEFRDFSSIDEAFNYITETVKEIA